jgi:hypothetical protein
MTDNHAGRALRPLSINIPLKVGTNFEVREEGDIIYVNIGRTFDFSVDLSIENYGTLANLIDALSSAQEAELQRIKKHGAEVRKGHVRSRPVQAVVREPVTPNPGLPEKVERRKRLRRSR